MTEFAKTCKQIEDISCQLDAFEANAFWGGHQAEIDLIREDLHGQVRDKVRKFQARIEESDPNKRTYGASMEAKVRGCLALFEEVLLKFDRVAAAVAQNHQTYAEDQLRAAAELKLQQEQEEAERRRQEEESLRAKEEAERVRKQQLQEAAVQEELERQAMILRRHEHEQAVHAQKEFEARQELHAVEKRERQKLEEDIRARQRKEEAREEKRRRLGTILEQHRQVKEKGELQLVAEALAMSLREAEATKAAEPQASAATEVPMEVDEEPKKADEKLPVPPAADLETEEMLIKQAIELSLQLSPATEPSTEQSKGRQNS